MDPDLIYDVGLHRGEDAEFYLKKGFRVVGVEADPQLCEIARRRLLGYVDSGQLTIVNVAVAERAGPLRFYANRDNSVWGTTSQEWAERNEKMGASSHEITVEGVHFGALLGEFGVPYYMKVDVEGADLLCFEALREFSSRPRFVSIESDKTSWSGLLREFELLKSLGYSKFKVIDQHRVDQQRCPHPAREGRDVDHQFPFGSSGLFGEEAPGPWISERGALRRYRRTFLRYRLFGDAGIIRNMGPRLMNYRLTKALGARMRVGWYDTHASL